MRILLHIVALTVLTMSASAQANIEAHPDSRFWIEGSSSVSQFVCRVDSVWGEGRLTDSGPERLVGTGVQAAGPQGMAEAHLRVPVAVIDCGDRRITRDLRGSLRSDEFPEIRFELDPISTSKRSESGALPDRGDVAGVPIEAAGSLTIAGHTESVTITGTLQVLSGGLLRLRGSKDLLLTDFGIDPPTKLFGLIKVHNEIDVHFDLIGARRESAQPAG
ncbi:MAG: hypothetical protein ACI80V_001587 [Rhodothermales bacterium]|jgi:hypothetical protein